MAQPRGRSTPQHAKPTTPKANDQPSSSRPSPERHPPLLRHSAFYLGFFATLGALLGYALGQVVYQVRSVLLLIAVAMFLAAGLDPLVRWLGRHGLSRAWGVVVVFVGLVLGFLAFGFALVPVVADQIGSLVESVPTWAEQLQQNPTISRLEEEYGIVSQAQEQLTGGGVAQQVFGGLVGVGLAVAGALVSAFTVLILTLYFLATLPAIKEAGYRLAPASRRARVRELGDEILHRIGSYVGGVAIIATIAGVLSTIFMLIIGLGEYAVALGLVVGLLSFIPVVGATIAGALIAIIGFLESIPVGIAVVVYFLVYQQIEAYVLYPRVMKRSVDVPGAVTVVAALVGGALLGVIGALVAVPVAAAILLLLRQVVVPRQEAQ